MMVGLIIAGLSTFDLYSNGFTWSVLGCVLLGFYLAIHDRNT